MYAEFRWLSLQLQDCELRGQAPWWSWLSLAIVFLVSFKMYRRRHSTRETILALLVSVGSVIFWSLFLNVSGTTDCGAGGPFNSIPLVVNDSDWVFFVLLQLPAGYLILLAGSRLYEQITRNRPKKDLNPHLTRHLNNSNPGDEGNFRRYL